MAAQDTGRLFGIDYLRAFFSVCVVAVHLGYVFPSLIFDKERYPEHTFTASDFVNFYVLCLAVPVFVLVSTYLLALRPATDQVLLRRLGRMGRLLVFWTVLYEVFFYTGYGFVKRIPHEPTDLALFVMSACNTVYYFFLCLMLVTAVAHLVRQAPGVTVWGLFAASTLVVGALPLVQRATGNLFPAHHANPLNFLPFAFAGVGLGRLSAAGAGRTLDRIGLGCLLLAAAAAVLDWTVYVDPCFFKVNQFAIPAYTRPSLVFLAVAVVVLAVRGRWSGNRVVGWMSRHSLGVYCLHPFFLPIQFKMVQTWHLTGWGDLLLPLALVLALSYVGSAVMPLFVRPEVIR